MMSRPGQKLCLIQQYVQRQYGYTSRMPFDVYLLYQVYSTSKLFARRFQIFDPVSSHLFVPVYFTCCLEHMYLVSVRTIIIFYLSRTYLVLSSYRSYKGASPPSAPRMPVTQWHAHKAQWLAHNVTIKDVGKPILMRKYRQERFTRSGATSKRAKKYTYLVPGILHQSVRILNDRLVINMKIKMLITLPDTAVAHEYHRR